MTIFSNKSNRKSDKEYKEVITDASKQETSGDYDIIANIKHQKVIKAKLIISKKAPLEQTSDTKYQLVNVKLNKELVISMITTYEFFICDKTVEEIKDYRKILNALKKSLL
jgi:hypothetical protein